jgi:hypothetical protein
LQPSQVWRLPEPMAEPPASEGREREFAAQEARLSATP